LKNAKIFIPVLSALILFLFSYSGCSDDTNNTIVNPQSPVTVSGKVLNIVNQTSPNVRVQIGEQSVVTSSDGSFSFNNISTPYNLRLIDDAGNNTKYFYGITSGQLRIPGSGSVDDSVQCEIRVSFPPEILSPGVTGKIIFTDFNYVNAYGFLSQDSPMNVWLPDNSPVTGKIILITYKTDASGKIISYENFGQSAPLQVMNGGKYTYNFSAEEVALNPGEVSLSGTINKQPGFNEGITNYFLTFSNKKTPNYSVLLSFENITGNNFNVVTPANLPLEFSNMIFSYSTDGMVNNSELFKLPEGPSGISLDTKSAPELLTPEDNAVNVTTSTLFTFSAGTGSGIYQVNLYDLTLQKNYVICISSNSFSLNDFSDLFPDGISNSVFKWSVEKIGHSNSINEFVTVYSDRSDYFRTNTTERNFTAAK
jgi:hypothetical protein